VIKWSRLCFLKAIQSSTYLLLLHAKGFESVKVIIKLAERVVFLPSHVLFGFWPECCSTRSAFSLRYDIWQRYLSKFYFYHSSSMGGRLSGPFIHGWTCICCKLRRRLGSALNILCNKSTKVGLSPKFQCCAMAANWPLVNASNLSSALLAVSQGGNPQTIKKRSGPSAHTSTACPSNGPLFLLISGDI
jgi:hypothetical protein